MWNCTTSWLTSWRCFISALHLTIASSIQTRFAIMAIAYTMTIGTDSTVCSTQNSGWWSGLQPMHSSPPWIYPFYLASSLVFIGLLVSTACFGYAPSGGGRNDAMPSMPQHQHLSPKIVWKAGFMIFVVSNLKWVWLTTMNFSLPPWMISFSVPSPFRRHGCIKLKQFFHIVASNTYHSFNSELLIFANSSFQSHNHDFIPRQWMK